MTIVKSIKVKGYPHRVHRSKKGRKPYDRRNRLLKKNLLSITVKKYD